jgi:hypothetical protein
MPIQDVDVLIRVLLSARRPIVVVAEIEDPWLHPRRLLSFRTT